MLKRIEFLDKRLPVRFWNKVVIDTAMSCWLWIGSKVKGGYGKFYWTGKLQIASRVVKGFEDYIPPELQVDHICRVKNCVNPEHLEVVTPRENTRRARNHFNTNETCLGCGRSTELIRIGRCSECVTAYDADYYTRNRERKSMTNKAYYRANRARLLKKKEKSI